MTECDGCLRWFDTFCSYVTFNSMVDDATFMYDCPCKGCLVKVICELPCETLGNYFTKNLQFPPVKKTLRRFGKGLQNG